MCVPVCENRNTFFMHLLPYLNVILKFFQTRFADGDVRFVENDAPVLQHRNALLADNVGAVYPNEILGGQYGLQLFQ